MEVRGEKGREGSGGILVAAECGQGEAGPGGEGGEGGERGGPEPKSGLGEGRKGGREAGRVSMGWIA